MAVKLIAMDMDGTLLDSRQRLTAGNVEALKLAEKKGVKLAICSGRCAGDSALFALENGFEDMAILGLNGGYCLENPREAAYANHVMDGETAKRCLRLAREANVTVGCFLQNRIAVFEGDTPNRELFWSGSWGDDPLAPVYLNGEEAFRNAFPDGVNKMVFIDETREKLPLFRKKLESLPQLDVTSSWWNNLELMPRGIEKGHAVRELAEKLGLSRDEVMAIGDYDNDLGMLRYAGYSVAMANASENVKNSARYHTLSNDEDGVAAAIHRFVLSR